jgi:8-oxo-dGTP pyrophosphatase MutT (NUDIX family)
VPTERAIRLVRAAGGLVVREGEHGPEVLLVHRQRYDDWTFPKGKVDPGESDEDAARREVEEETGFRCALDLELPSTQYVDARGRPKVVRYRPTQGGALLVDACDRRQLRRQRRGRSDRMDDRRRGAGPAHV